MEVYKSCLRMATHFALELSSATMPYFQRYFIEAVWEDQFMPLIFAFFLVGKNYLSILETFLCHQAKNFRSDGST